MTNRLKIICNSYHKHLNDQFLDHFRAGLQGDAYLLQASPFYFTDFEMSDVINPPAISIRFNRPVSGTLWISNQNKQRKSYRQKVLVRKRGFPCEQFYYPRPIRDFSDFQNNGFAGWSMWFDVLPGREISVFSHEPTPLTPAKAWFGPYSIEELFSKWVQFS